MKASGNNMSLTDTCRFLHPLISTTRFHACQFHLGKPAALANILDQQISPKMVMGGPAKD